MSNVIQFADVRRAKLDKIAAQQTAKDVDLCLFITSGYQPKSKPRILEAILEVLDESERVRLVLRELGEAV